MSTMNRRNKLPTINPKNFEKLCEIQCTKYEVLDFFGVNKEQMDRWCRSVYFDADEQPQGFNEVYNRYQQRGKASLRRKQWLLADKHPQMAIHLDKKIFGDEQARDSEVQEIAVTIKRHSDRAVEVPPKINHPDNKSADYLDAISSMGVDDDYIPPCMQGATERVQSDWNDTGEVTDNEQDKTPVWDDDDDWDV